MQLVRIFIIASIIAFVPVLALPVGVDSQALVAREPSVSEWFKGLGAKIKGAFQTLGKKIRSIGKKKKQKKSTPPPVEAREQAVVFAREDAYDLYVRELDDEIYVREFDNDDFEAREFDDEIVAREFDEELDAREPTQSVVAINSAYSILISLV